MSTKKKILIFALIILFVGLVFLGIQFYRYNSYKNKGDKIQIHIYDIYTFQVPGIETKGITITNKIDKAYKRVLINAKCGVWNWGSIEIEDFKPNDRVVDTIRITKIDSYKGYCIADYEVEEYGFWEWLFI